MRDSQLYGVVFVGGIQGLKPLPSAVRLVGAMELFAFWSPPQCRHGSGTHALLRTADTGVAHMLRESLSHAHAEYRESMKISEAGASLASLVS